MIDTYIVVLTLGPMPTAVANQQSATAAPFRPCHSDAFAHQPFVGFLGHMNSTLLLQPTEAGVAATQISHIRATGMPVANGGIALLEQRMLGKVCLLYTSPSPRDVEESRMPSSA